MRFKVLIALAGVLALLSLTSPGHARYVFDDWSIVAPEREFGGTLGEDGLSWAEFWFSNRISAEGITENEFEWFLWIGGEPTSDETFTLVHTGLTNIVNATMLDDDDDYIMNSLTLNGPLNMSDNAITNVGYIDFDTANGIAQAEARMVWNDDDGTLNLGLAGGVVNLQMGQEMVIRGKNTSGVTISNGMAVRISGASGSNPEFGLSEADDPATAGSLGVATEDIANGQFGYVTIFGRVREVDTTGTPVSETWAAADRLYVSNTAGELTNVAPTGNERKIFIGVVLRVHATEGMIFVSPINVSYFNELSGPLLTNKSVPFVNSTGMLVDDNANLFYDDANDELVVKDFGREAEMYADEITIALTAGAWANVAGLTNGLVSANGMVQNGTDGSITVANGGRYKTILGTSIENNDVPPAEEYHMAYKVNGSVVEKCEQHRSVSIQAALGSMTVPCMLDLPNGAIVIPVANSVGGDDLTIEHLNWLLFK